MKKRIFLATILALAVLTVFVAPRALALFTNGGFETGDFTGWTKSTYLNYGLGTPCPPCTITKNPGGTDRTLIRTGPTGSMSDPDTGGVVKFPKYGNSTAVVNFQGNMLNANTLVQQTTTTAGDVDPGDGLIHIRFGYAVVLQDPGHSPQDQPYFYVRLYNVTKAKTLFSQFAYTGSGGLPWQTYNSPTAGTVKFLDWQIMDIAPSAADLAVGDVVELEVDAAGCAQGGHWGYVYVDGFGATIPTPSQPSTTTLGSSVNPSVWGQSVTFTANVSGAGGTPTGNVTFYADGNAICTNVALSGGSATCTTSSLSVGSHNITADYSGDSNYDPSSGSLPTQTVNKANATTTITSDLPDPSVYGQNYTVNFTVAATAPGAGTPSGTVTVSDGAGNSCSGPAPAGSCTLPSTAPGAKTLTATYSGDANFNGSSDTEPHTVNKANTTTTLASSVNPTFWGQDTTFTANVAVVAPGAGTPTGNITFYDNGVAIPACTNVPMSGLSATCTYGGLDVGTHNITAQYNGDANFNTSTSGPLAQTVDTLIAGTVFFDANGNGIYDIGVESGIPGAVVTLRNAAGNVVAVRNTGGLGFGSGTYSFRGFPPGDYTVSVTYPSGYSGGTSNDVPVRLLSTRGTRYVDFGGVRPAAPTATPTATPTPAGGDALFRRGLNGYNGVEDTFLENVVPTNTHGSDVELSLGWANSSGIAAKSDANTAMRSLFKFDVSSIPGNATVTQATFEVWTSNYESQPSPYVVNARLYTMLRNWLEHEANWDVATNLVNWEVAGAEGETDRSFTAIVTTTIGMTETRYLMDVTALVQQWVSDPASNFGMMLLPFIPENAIAQQQAGNEFRLISSENENEEHRPALAVSYILTPPVPTPTSTPTPMPVGVIRFEAEAGNVYAPMEVQNRTDASACAYVAAPAGARGGYASYTFNVATAGNYVLWVRSLAPDETHNSVSVKMDNGAAQIWNMTPANTWAWRRMAVLGVPIQFSLKAGSHTLEIYNREPGTLLDVFELVNSTSYVPSAVSSCP